MLAELEFDVRTAADLLISKFETIEHELCILSDAIDHCEERLQEYVGQEDPSARRGGPDLYVQDMSRLVDISELSSIGFTSFSGASAVSATSDVRFE